MVVLGVCEGASDTVADKVTIYTGPGEFSTVGKVTPLTLVKASAFQYFSNIAPDGNVTHESGPVSKYLDEGVCPMSGSKCTVKDKFFAKSSTDHFVVFKKEGSTYSPTPVAGPCIYMPAPEEYVAKFDMTSPSATKEDFVFTYFSSAPQTMTMVVPGVDGGSLKLLVSLAINPTTFAASSSGDLMGELIAAARSDYTAGATSYPKMKAAGKAGGFVISGVTALGIDDTETDDSPMGMLEKQAVADKMKMEMAVQGAIAKQEVYLAGYYAKSQNAVVTVSQLVNANVHAITNMAAMAKGSGGSDKNYSRVAACCCCSVATKTSGGAWASLDASGSTQFDVTAIINSAMTATGGGLMGGESGSFEYYEEEGGIPPLP